MQPKDDLMWPVCDSCPPSTRRKLCQHNQTKIVAGKDNVEPGIDIAVPVVSKYERFARVRIEPDLIANMCAPMFLVLDKSDPFSIDSEELIELGLWTRGEGRLIIALTIQDWITRTLDDEKCKSAHHGYSEEMVLQASIERGPDEIKLNRWLLATAGLCIGCEAAGTSLNSQAGAAVQNNFGLNDLLSGRRQ